MKADLSKRFSQATSKAVMEELLRFDVPPKPKSRAANLEIGPSAVGEMVV